jgi:hypothetical protein
MSIDRLCVEVKTGRSQQHVWYTSDSVTKTARKLLKGARRQPLETHMTLQSAPPKVCSPQHTWEAEASGAHTGATKTHAACKTHSSVCMKVATFVLLPRAYVEMAAFGFCTNLPGPFALQTVYPLLHGGLVLTMLVHASFAEAEYLPSTAQAEAALRPSY